MIEKIIWAWNMVCICLVLLRSIKAVAKDILRRTLNALLNIWMLNLIFVPLNFIKIIIFIARKVFIQSLNYFIEVSIIHFNRSLKLLNLKCSARTTMSKMMPVNWMAEWIACVGTRVFQIEECIQRSLLPTFRSCNRSIFPPFPS